MLRSFGISWALTGSVKDPLFGWESIQWTIWNLVPLHLMWILWQERNRRMFEDTESTRDRLLIHFFGPLFDWSQVLGLTNRDSVPMFIGSLSYCIQSFVFICNSLG